MRNTAIISPPFGGLKKCSFLGKRRSLCRPDAPERKTYGRWPSGRLGRGKHGILDSFWGGLWYSTLVFENKNAIGLIPMAKNKL